MKVILLSDVRKVGKKYDVKNVADGYALNFLIPNNLALVADTGTVKSLELKKTEEEKHKKTEEVAAMKILEDVKGKKLEILAKVNEKGHLFKGIHSEEIAAELRSHYGVILASESIMLDKPIKEVGEKEVNIKIMDKVVKLTVEIKSL